MRKLATVRRVHAIRPIDGADRIELAEVDGWKCVIKKGEFRPGDLVIYCEIDSFLPIREEFEFLRKSSYKRMGDQEGFRLRTVKLRGQISQGLLLAATVVGRTVELGEDVTDELGIVKYEAPIPACLNGQVLGGFPAWIAKTDEERIQNLAEEYPSYLGTEFYVSEKVDGTSFTAYLHDGSFGVCGRNWCYAEDDANSYWIAARKYGLPEQMPRLNRSLAIQAELIGPGIQKNRYAVKEPQLYVFNIFDIDASTYVEKQEMESLSRELGLGVVPFIEVRQPPATIEEILQLAEGKSLLNPATDREGLVWVHGSGNDRISFKTISNRFLAKHGE